MVNDAWGAWRGGTETGWGLVAIAGTGNNVAGRTPSGQTKTGFGLTYEFGSRGGEGGAPRDAPQDGLPPEAAAAMNLIPALFELASAGDAVAQQIIMDNATALGELAGGMAKLLHLEQEEVEVVIAGSLFQRPLYPLYYDAFITALHRAVPHAWTHRPRLSPAVGAYLLGLEAGGVAVTDAVHASAAGNGKSTPT